MRAFRMSVTPVIVSHFNKNISDTPTGRVLNYLCYHNERLSDGVVMVPNVVPYAYRAKPYTNII